MRDIERKKAPTNNQTKQTVRTPKRENKSVRENGRKLLNGKETHPKPSISKPASNRRVGRDANVGATVQPSVEVYENVEVHYVDDSSDFGKEMQQVNKAEESDYESVKDSASSQGDRDSLTADDENIESSSRVSKRVSKNAVVDHHQKSTISSVKKTSKSSDSEVLMKTSSDKKKVMDKREQEVFDEASNGTKSTESDDETVGAEERVVMREKVEEMENRVEKLEEELKEVAALEISLYSVVPEHGSSAHKVHTPARRLSRLYIHACKQWTRSKRATIARNTVSGLVLVAKTCGNDVARLTFWLSNIVVLREIISQAFGISHQQTQAPYNEQNVTSLKLKRNSGGKPVSKTTQMFEDWEETSTFIAALEKIESWIFSRVVESVWWQALTPNMLSPVEDLISHKSIGRLSGPALGDQQQGAFAIELWKNAFQGAFQRLCPVRAAGHECGCLPAVARMVMEQCIARLDVAIFNAILRESAHQIPTDPVSDPIVDSRVLPIPAGDLSFGSGAQLKNSVGNWSRWFSNSLGMETDSVSDDNQTTHAKTKCFRLLNELSDLLMLPKDMLMDRSIRHEVCPSISLAVLIRILCNFTPDEFCPDAVPGEVLEAMNAESFVERKIAGGSSGSFPYAAAVVVYSPPSSEDVAEKVAEAGGKPQLERNTSMVQKKGYTSDEELDDLDSPLSSFIEPPSPSAFPNGNGSLKSGDRTGFGGNLRYELLREVWSL